MTAADGDVWRVYGLDVRSPIPLSRSRAATAEPDVTIALRDPRPTPAELPGRCIGESLAGDQVVEAAYEADGVVSLLFPGYLVAHFDLPRAVCEVIPDPGGDPAMLHRLVAGSVVATWMILNDLPVLHASAVAIDGRAALFVGNTGSGKTTLAAALVGAGASAISDDICRLEERDGGWLCHPDAGQLRLREGSAGLAAMFSDDAVVPGEGRITLAVPTVEHAVPLGAIVVPRISTEAQALVATRLRGARSVLALLEHPRMASLLGGELSAALFRFGTAVVSAVPTWELSVPAGSVTPQLGQDLLLTLSDMLGAPPRP